ncbi:uncharacterized protein TrAtP1_006277 [Trichoderma atroviride]|uniref:Hydrophobin n=1 Tax=Hypocrea atroviridis TaxID=63577 RepID=A7LNW3_HYPAT|nr:hydrophobin [Trichoderma atroviride]UKZ65075.1 hypothetical protein TrAtP1_006277 [Trichoderma atroviride]
MQFSIVAIFATGAFAAICPTGLYSNPLCCGSGILGVVFLDCEAPKAQVSDSMSFQNACAAVGLQPLCCAAPTADQGIICQMPAGTI